MPAASSEVLDQRGMSASRPNGEPLPPDDRSFVEMVELEHPAVVAAAAMVVGSASMAEEIAQDAFERAYVRWAKVGRMDRPGAWVRRVALNQAISVTRRRSTEHRVLGRVWRAGVGNGDHPTVPSEPSGVDGEATRLWSAVRRLPTNQARAVALHYGSDLSLEMVAAEMETSVSSIKSLLHRARTTLRNDRTIKELEEQTT